MQFSLPQPKGGRDAITKNPILREDQLPMKYLHPKNKKKNKEVKCSFKTYIKPQVPCKYLLEVLVWDVVLVTAQNGFWSKRQFVNIDTNRSR